MLITLRFYVENAIFNQIMLRYEKRRILWNFSCSVLLINWKVWLIKEFGVIIRVLWFGRRYLIIDVERFANPHKASITNSLRCTGINFGEFWHLKTLSEFSWYYNKIFVKIKRSYYDYFYVKLKRKYKNKKIYCIFRYY